MQYLLLGGPAHGQERDLPNGESELIVMAPSPGNPLPTPFRYVLREIEAETRPGFVFKRSIMVESTMDPDLAYQAVAATLMQRFAEQLVLQFMEGGERVGAEDTSGIDSSRSGLLVAKR